MILRLVTAPVNRGKTTLLRAMRAGALREGRSVGGFLTRPEWDAEGLRKKGFFLDILGSETSDPEEQLKIAGSDPCPGAAKIGRFYLYPEALSLAYRAVKRSMSADITIIDEIGPAEMSGGGHHEALTLALHKKTGELWVALRSSLLEDFLNFLHHYCGTTNLQLPDIFISQPWLLPR